LKRVSDIPNIDEVIRLIDEYYGISVKEVEGWDDVSNLRATVNDFKHRDGTKRWKDCWGEDGLRFPQQREFRVEQAYKAMERVKSFLLALDAAIEIKSKGSLDSF
jgi:hypothetical protein